MHDSDGPSQEKKLTIRTALTWAGVVHFEHSSANLTARIGRLLGDPAALARCRRQTYHVFRHRFDVAAIFRRAKVPDLLQSLGWRRAPPR